MIKVWKNLAKNLSFCQGKNIAYPSPLKPSPFRPKKLFTENYFFLDVPFFVVFFVLGCFVPHAIFSHLPHLILHIDLFIPFKLIFVKTFLVF